MNVLKDKWVKVIIDSYNGGLSIRETARKIRCSPITVRKYLQEANIQIRTISQGMHNLYKGMGRQVVLMRIPKSIKVKYLVSIGCHNIKCSDCKKIFDCDKFGIR